MELVYGLHSVDALLRQQPEQVQRLWVQDARKDKRIAAIIELASNQGVAVERLPRADLDSKVQGRHQGVVAEVRREDERKWDEAALNQLLDQLDGPALLLVLDGVTDPHNLGACLRSADAAGAHAVIVPKDNSADLTPVVRKVACGAAEVVPFVRVTNLARTLESLKERGIWLYGAAGEADKSIYNNDLKGPMALVMGAEGAGLRRLTREACDYLVKLPMAGSVSSLNVSVATGVCLFEVVRQRAGTE
jgi:23S rRNA (guanosine2251-2'-O)-methyltransferase